jgi:hypothetical protein
MLDAKLLPSRAGILRKYFTNLTRNYTVSVKPKRKLETGYNFTFFGTPESFDV